jgi:hypothetical protein
MHHNNRYKHLTHQERGQNQLVLILSKFFLLEAAVAAVEVSVRLMEVLVEAVEQDLIGISRQLQLTQTCQLLSAVVELVVTTALSQRAAE